MEPIKLDRVLKNLIAQSPHQHKLKEAAVVCAWNQVMSLAIIKRTETIRVKDNKLFLKINSSPLRQEIQNSKVRVLELLKEADPACELIDIIWL